MENRIGNYAVPTVYYSDLDSGERIKKGKYELFGFKNKRSFIYIDDAIDATIDLSNIKKIMK